MEIIIHVDVRKFDKNSKLAIDEYAKRTSPFCKVAIKTYKDVQSEACDYVYTYGVGNDLRAIMIIKSL